MAQRETTGRRSRRAGYSDRPYTRDHEPTVPKGDAPPLALEVGTFEIDVVQNLTRFSPELCTILGLPDDSNEFSYLEASRFIHKEDRAAIQANIEAAADRRDTGKWSGVCRIVRTDGKLRWVSISARRTHCDDKPVNSLGTVVDITPLKQTEEALQEGMRRIRLALDAARVGTFEADIAASHAHVDENAATLLGLAGGAQVIPIEQLREKIPFDDLEASDVKEARMTEHGEAYHHEFRVRTNDGSERWLSAVADIRAGRVFGVNFDITPRKLAELARDVSEDRLRTATAAAALGIFEWEPISDRVTWLNDRMFEIMGRTRAEGAIDRKLLLAHYLHRDDVSEFDAALNEAVRTRGTLHATCRIKRPDGSRHWLQIDGRIEELFDKPARLVGVVADITSRKRLELRAKRLSQRLLIAQEEERRNIAQELHDSTVQHLVAADLFLAALGNRLDGKDQEALNMAHGSLAEATRELRTFSYLMHPPMLRGQELYQSLERYIRGFADRTGLACELRVDRKTDRYLLRIQRVVFRIVQEGLANTYRHASATHVAVNLRRIGGRLHVIVTDNGSGIPIVHHPSARTGVGLQSIRIRLRQLGGRFKVRRVLAGGTRLHASLPV